MLRMKTKAIAIVLVVALITVFTVPALATEVREPILFPNHYEIRPTTNKFYRFTDRDVQNDDIEGLLNENGDVVLVPDHTFLSFSEGMGEIFTWQKSSGRHLNGFIDESGKIVIEPIYENAGPFSEGVAIVWGVGPWSEEDPTLFIIDKAGNVILDLTEMAREECFSDASEAFNNGLAVFYGENECIAINLKGEIVHRFDPNIRVDRYRYGFASFSGPDGCGYVDLDGNVVLSGCGYSSDFDENGFATITKDGKVIIINNKFEQVFPFPDMDECIADSGNYSIFRNWRADLFASDVFDQMRGLPIVWLVQEHGGKNSRGYFENEIGIFRFYDEFGNLISEYEAYNRVNITSIDFSGRYNILQTPKGSIILDYSGRPLLKTEFECQLINEESTANDGVF